jgi:hypothetical protein
MEGFVGKRRLVTNLDFYTPFLHSGGQAMKKLERFSVQKVTGDGRCLFRALVRTIFDAFVLQFMNYDFIHFSAFFVVEYIC